MLKHEFKVDKTYLVDCCRNDVEVEPFVAIDDDIDDAVIGLMKQIIYSKTGLLPESEIVDIEKELGTENSPEHLLYHYVEKEIDELSERIQSTYESNIKPTLDIPTLDPTQLGNIIKMNLVIYHRP